MRLERQIANEMRKQRVAESTKGEGMYVFANNTKGDLFLPRPTHSGRRLVGRGEEFLGDSYYFGMLKTNELRLIREVAAPTLLTEQPPTVTTQGTVEFVQEAPVRPLNEDTPPKPPADVLLVEKPVEGLRVVR